MSEKKKKKARAATGNELISAFFGRRLGADEQEETSASPTPKQDNSPQGEVRIYYDPEEPEGPNDDTLPGTARESQPHSYYPEESGQSVWREPTRLQQEHALDEATVSNLLGVNSASREVPRTAPPSQSDEGDDVFIAMLVDRLEKDPTFCRKLAEYGITYEPPRELVVIYHDGKNNYLMEEDYNGEFGYTKLLRPVTNGGILAGVEPTKIEIERWRRKHSR